MADDDNPELRRRKYVPPVKKIADELIRDYRTGEDAELGQGVLDFNRTLDSWQETAKVHGDEFNEEDWGALVLELVRRVDLLERASEE